MKALNNATLTLLLLLFSHYSYAQDLSLVSSGIENKEFYRIDNHLNLIESHPWINELNNPPSMYYKFTKGNYNDPIYECIDRHVELWKEYKNNCSQNNLTPEKNQFFVFKEMHDHFCTQYARQSAPSLYYDFVGNPNNTYVLNRIEIETLGFKTYFGGGFEIGEAWYDIVLCHEKGVKDYPIDRRLAITNGIGRIQLRFWSDYYDADYGWISPMGLYVIQIKFIFSINGNREIVISTNPFAIDV